LFTEIERIVCFVGFFAIFVVTKREQMWKIGLELFFYLT